MASRTSWLKNFLVVAHYGPLGATALAPHLSRSRVSAHVAAPEHPPGMTPLDRKARQRQLDIRASGSSPRGDADRSG